MSKNTMFDVVKKELAILEDRMHDAVVSPVGLVTDIGNHLVNAGGKRIRPALCILAAYCQEYQREKIMPLAVAIEMIHMATLVHDDVIDAAEQRRGSVTANTEWGNQMAILSGDYLFAKAFSMVIKAGYSHEVLAVLAQIICDLSEGEINQNQITFKASRDIEEYKIRIAKKTANFIAASCQSGAMVAGLSRENIDALYSYGYSIGMAFQITDDLLDITATTEQIGKPAGNDIVQGIVTLPVIRALNVSEAAAELEKIVSTRDITDEQRKRALDIIRATDAVEYSYAEVKKYLAEARSALPAELPEDVRKAYCAVADFIEIRKF